MAGKVRVSEVPTRPEKQKQILAVWAELLDCVEMKTREDERHGRVFFSEVKSVRDMF